MRMARVPLMLGPGHGRTLTQAKTDIAGNWAGLPTPSSED